MGMSRHKAEATHRDSYASQPNADIWVAALLVKVAASKGEHSALGLGSCGPHGRFQCSVAVLFGYSNAELLLPDTVW